MDTERRSFDLKVDRAEKHLVEIEDALRRYADRHPYTVRKEIEGKQKRVVHRLQISEQPDPTVGVILGDIVYNLRSALDHLMVSLVPASRARSVYFPIYFQGVWEPVAAGEDNQRTKARQRWESDTRKAHPQAIAILQNLQPPDGAGDALESMHGLIALNRLAVKDRHTKLPVLASALRYPHGSCRTADGAIFQVRPIGGGEGVRDGTILVVPDGAVDVQIEGTPVVLVRDGWDEGGYLIPHVLRNILLRGTRQVIDMLRPFVVRR